MNFDNSDKNIKRHGFRWVLWTLIAVVIIIVLALIITIMMAVIPGEPLGAFTNNNTTNTTIQP
jgi:membrane-anchored glycerophosphoryl diester phosphodiesterase (GDPDase)